MAATSAIAYLEEIVGSSALQLLIVESERTVREACRDLAQSLGFATVAVDNAAAAWQYLEAQPFDVIFAGLGAGDISVAGFLKELKQRRPEAALIACTAAPSITSAVECMRAGATDYLAKPFDATELRAALERAGEQVRARAEARAVRAHMAGDEGYCGMVGRSPEMQKVYRIVAKVAASAHPVLITGESGTGKEMVARAIHFAGPHRGRPFIPVDCGSLVPTLIESELFGHVKGAFTGANRSKDGLLTLAEGGTVFLDEIGELPVDLQAKLLRALQEKEIRPVGGTRSHPINVRVVAATNRNLEQAIQNGTFRKDLYYRLNVVNLRIPPLRERREDIPLLIRHFMDRQARATGVERSLSDQVLKLMMTYDWPGNVRELENALERAATMSSGPLIHVGDMPSMLQNYGRVEELSAPAESIASMAELEKQAILTAIARVNGDKLQAARLLGIGKTTLYRKLKEYRPD